MTELDPGHRLPQEPLDPTPDPSSRRRRDTGGPDLDDGDGGPDTSRILWLLVGAAAIAGGTALGWDATALASIVTPPPPIRAALVGLSVAVGVILLLSAVNRLSLVDGDAASSGRSRDTRRPLDARGIGSMIRGVRLVFLAVAAFAAGSGWAIGHPLPLVVALVIAGVDVLETSFLLIVVGLRRR
jgi:hypothetical protein